MRSSYSGSVMGPNTSSWTLPRMFMPAPWITRILGMVGPSALERRDGLDLDERVGDREVSDLHQRAGGRIGPEELRAHLAVRLAIPDVGDEDGDLHYVVHLAAARLDDHLDLLEDAARLRFDVALADEVAILVEWQLARDVDVVAHAPAERVARPLILHAGRSDRNAGHDESPLSGKRGSRSAPSLAAAALSCSAWVRLRRSNRCSSARPRTHREFGARPCARCPRPPGWIVLPGSRRRSPDARG